MKIKTIYLFILFFLCSNLFSQEGDFSVEIQAGPVFYNFDNTSRVVFSQNFNYSTGIFIKHNIQLKRSVISLRTGYLVERKKYKQIFSDTISWYPHQVTTSFIYGSIPLLIEYTHKINSRYYPFISTGIILRHILKEERETILNDGTKREGFPVRSQNLKNPKDFYLSMGINIRFSKMILMQFEPFIRYQINEGAPDNQDIYGRFAFGIRLGMLLDFTLLQKD